MVQAIGYMADTWYWSYAHMRQVRRVLSFNELMSLHYCLTGRAAD
jgi:hypothetical protein